MSRVLVISPFPPPADGIAEHTRHIVSRWVPHHEVAVLASGSTGSETLTFEGSTRTVEVNRVLRTFATADAVRFVERFRPDVVYCQFAISALTSSLRSVFAACTAARGAGARIVFGFHEPVREVRALPVLGRLLYRYAARFCDVAVCFSTAAAQVLSEIAGGRDVEVVPHGVPALGSGDPGIIRDITARYGERPIVLALGFTHPDKGADTLVEAAPLLAASCPETDPVVLIAGSPRTRSGLFKIKGRADIQHHAYLRERAAELAAGNVSFCEYVPSEELPSLLAATSVAVLPYRNITQSGIASLVTAAAVPAVVSDLPGLREQFANAAVYVPIGEPAELAAGIAALLNDPGAAQGLRAAAQRIRADSTYDVVASRILELARVAP